MVGSEGKHWYSVKHTKKKATGLNHLKLQLFKHFSTWKFEIKKRRKFPFVVCSEPHEASTALTSLHRSKTQQTSKPRPSLLAHVSRTHAAEWPRRRHSRSAHSSNRTQSESRRAFGHKPNKRLVRLVLVLAAEAEPGRVPETSCLKSETSRTIRTIRTLILGLGTLLFFRFGEVWMFDRITECGTVFFSQTSDAHHFQISYFPFLLLLVSLENLCDSVSPRRPIKYLHPSYHGYQTVKGGCF